MSRDQNCINLVFETLNSNNEVEVNAYLSSRN